MYKHLTIKDKHGNPLKPHHHVYLNAQFILDCKVWKVFLDKASNVRLCWPFMDFNSQAKTYQSTSFHSDASKNKRLGIGPVFDNEWIQGLWPENFIRGNNPSIEFLELYALMVAIIAWQDDWKMSNTRIILFCDNQAVVHMVNNSGSMYSQCMKLIRIITLNNIRCNHRIKVQHVRTEKNVLADSLSRNDFKRFWKNASQSTMPTATQILVGFGQSIKSG